MSLAERIEAATGPDRELDAAIDALLGWSPVPNPTMAGGLIDMMHGPGGVTVRRNTPAYTGSIDAAMMLVAGLEGRSVWQVRTMLDHACYNAIKPRSTAADLAKDLPRYIAAAAIRRPAMTLDEFLKLPGAKVHDGSGCPVPLDSAPAVYFRDGFDPSDRGVYPKAGEWIFPNCGHDLWVWNERQSPADIIAYREAP